MQVVIPPGTWRPLEDSGGLTRSRRDALGTSVDLVLHPAAGQLRAQTIVDSILGEVDRAASRFRPDSDLSQLNRSAGSPVRVGGLLLELLAVALEAARSTGGLTDPTVGRSLLEAGYTDDFAALPSSLPAPGWSPPAEGAWRAVLVDGDQVQLPKGVLLDLGATAKAWAADRAAAAISSSVGGSVLVSLGGDLATAGAPPEGGWVVRLSDGNRSLREEPGQNVRLTAPALATSSTTQRRWLRAGRRMHHIIDPRTGRPSRGPWRTVSVAAGSCLAANAASTAAIVVGANAAGWLERRRLPARLVSNAGRALHVAGWPTEGEELPRVAAGFSETTHKADSTRVSTRIPRA